MVAPVYFQHFDSANIIFELMTAFNLQTELLSCNRYRLR